MKSRRELLAQAPASSFQVPDEVESESPLDAILSTLDRHALQVLLLRLADNHPELMVELQVELSRLKLGSAPVLPDANSPIDGQPYLISISDVRKQVRGALSAASEEGEERYDFDDGGFAAMEILSETIDPLIEMAEMCIGGGDNQRALQLLEAITDELISGWNEVEDYIGEADDLFLSLGDTWAEALLTTDLSLEIRQEWMTKIEGWREAECSWGADSGLAHASRAANEGWDSAHLVSKLSGDMFAAENTIVAPDSSSERLTNIRLKILERQGRLEDAAKLAVAEGMHDKYMDLLVTLGFAHEAVDYGALAITTAQSSLELARKLHDRNEAKLALQVAENGLDFAKNVYALAVWTRDAAYSDGKRDLAIRAGVLAIKDKSTLGDYLRLKTISEDLWPVIREEILTYIRRLGRAIGSEQADILLDEGLLLEALEGVCESYDYSLIEHVVEACLPVHPAAVIPICKAQAESILSLAKANRYHHAIRWLSLARDAYSNANNSPEWMAYKNDLMKTHSRKSSLMPGLRSL